MAQIRIPLGYTMEKGVVEINISQAQTVHQIYESYLAGKSLLSIAKNLTQKNVPNANGKTNWTHGAVIKILENRKYLGDQLYPSLVDETAFLAVQGLRQKLHRKRKCKAVAVMQTVYPPKPRNLIYPTEVRKLDELLAEGYGTVALLFERAETMYCYAKIYDME